MNIKLGKYKHFKGKIYEVIGTAIHTETNEELVIYHDSDSKEKIFVRPLNTFFEIIEKPEYSYKGPRFIYINN